MRSPHTDLHQAELSSTSAGAVNRWLSFRVDTAAGAVSLIAALFVIFARNMDPALAGFVMSFAMAFADRALWTTRLWSQLEMQANSVERVQECALL